MISDAHMVRDIRNTAVYQEAETLYRSLYRPGAGQISDARELHVSPDGRHAVFAGVLVDELIGTPQTRICKVDLASGKTEVLTSGPRSDRLPRYSRDGRRIAFLSDRSQPENFQLSLLDCQSGEVQSAPTVHGWVEYLQWSPDGQRILLGVAGHGADVSGGQGAISSEVRFDDAPPWAPKVDRGGESYQWRSVWIYEVSTGTARRVSTPGLNIWEAVWCGNDALAAVSSASPGEGSWYSAYLHFFELSSGASRRLYNPRDQLGCLAGSPSGSHVAIVEALCSDRCIVAGDLRIIDCSTGEGRSVDTRDVNITCTEWRSDQHLLLAGHCGFDAVVGHYNLDTGDFCEGWRSGEVATGGRYISVAGMGEPGDCALVGESFVRAPEIAQIRRGVYTATKSFDLGYAQAAEAIAAVDRVTWDAPDGLEIQGWLLRPQGARPHPLVLNIHGGPVWHWHPFWLGRARTLPMLLLAKHGHAIFLPNPRGSGGRGQDFVRRVVGDIGGMDAQDHLSGLDYLVTSGVADPERLGVTGISYGGFMTAWLITQDTRFAAAAPVAPHTNQVTEHLLSNIPQFVALFLSDHYRNLGGNYYQRSPIIHAHRVKTPTLSICGALDRCTPPEEAVQFHRALLENRIESVLVTYPQEGHGIHGFPAAIDYAARVVAWFDEQLGCR